MSIPLWLHCCPQLQPDTIAVVRASLERSGIRIQPGAGRRDGVALLLFERLSPALLEAGSRLSGGPAGATVLALCTSAELGTEDMWRLLDAGVADVLPWRAGCAEQVLARLQRWNAVRALVDSPAVAARLVGCSSAWRALMMSVAEVAAFTDSSVLITGETGTGKELVARCLHDFSRRHDKQFVALNCGGLPENLFESEIFGHEANAFTGAGKRRIGKIEHADGGTLFLDEVESMPLPLQIKLLRVLQERTLERLGSNQSVAVDCRVIAATKSDLDESSKAGEFRSDLYYRLNVVTLELPPLRERREDILQLFEHFTQQSALRFDRALPELDNQTLSNLMSHDWPGNVRELRNVAERFALGLPAFKKSGASSGGQGLAFAEAVEAFERNLLNDALQRSGGNLTQASLELGMAKTTLFDKVKKYGLSH